MCLWGLWAYEAYEAYEPYQTKTPFWLSTVLFESFYWIFWGQDFITESGINYITPHSLVTQAWYYLNIFNLWMIGKVSRLRREMSLSIILQHVWYMHEHFHEKMLLWHNFTFIFKLLSINTAIKKRFTLYSSYKKLES